MSILLPAKLIIPHTRPELISRTRLVERLTEGMYRTLTLISAPAGFGKTTLAVEWVKELTQNTTGNVLTDIAWLSLDEADNDYNRFLTYFLTAISRLECIDIQRAKDILEMLQSPNPPPVEALFSALIAELSSTDQKILLILDDYHLIEDRPIHTALNFWLENVPPQVHTVILTREDPPFPLARLRARDQLTELRAADLRFSEAESSQFLHDTMGLDLSSEAVTKLEGRTEGWIAGLQMAALSMRNRADIADFIENFSGTNRFILDYLLEEVLANQPPEIQRFLLRTSILRRLSAPLCDQLLELDHQSAEILKYLEQANLFLIPLDDERSWYRYHHLFADLLNARLQQTHSSKELADLHRRAAHWYEEHEMAFGAIYHASLIPDDGWVERIIDQNYMEIFQRRDSVAIRSWTGELGKELIFKRPQLAIHEANSRAWFGQLDEAEQLLNEAEKRLKGETPSADVQAMIGYLAYVRSRVTAMRGDFKQAIQLCLTARENTPASNQGLLGGIGVMLGYGYFLDGDFPQAAATLQETIRSGKRHGAVNTTIGAYCVLARLLAIQGCLRKSYSLYQEAEKFILRSEGQHLGAMSIVDVGFAEILYEWNQLEDALKHIQRGQDAIALWSKADDTALANVLHAQIQLAQGSLPAAEKSIELGSQAVRSKGMFTEARDAVAAAVIGIQLKKQDNLAVSRWVTSVEEKLPLDDPFRFKNELLLISLARVYLAQRKFEESLNLLAQLEVSAKAGGREGRLLKIRILQALVSHTQGRQAQAFSILESALAQAEAEGYVRTFVDEGLPMQRLLSQWLSQTKAASLKVYASHLADQFCSGVLPVQDKQAVNILPGKLVEPLSPREIEVLKLIALGKTNKEISDELIVAPGTVKAHTSSIYRKLDVSNRTEAAARARVLDLLS